MKPADGWPTTVEGWTNLDLKSLLNHGQSKLKAAMAVELDLIDQWAHTQAGLAGLPAHIAKCADALKYALRHAGIFPDVALRVATETTLIDREWFAIHTNRTHRLRAAITQELVVSVFGDPPASCVIVQQTAPGTRFLVAIPDGLTNPRVEPLPFMDTTDEGFVDRDVFLAQLFDVLCRNPGQPINVSALISNTKALTHDAVLK